MARGSIRAFYFARRLLMQWLLLVLLIVNLVGIVSLHRILIGLYNPDSILHRLTAIENKLDSALKIMTQL
jgi:hypothetical protein